MKRFKFSNYTLTIFFALFLVLVSCEKDVQQDITVNDDLELYTETSLNSTDVINDVITESEAEGFKCAQPFEICGDYKVYPLIASQRYFAGALMVYNDADYLYVTYYSWYRLSDFHLFVGDVEALPINGGNNPQIGLFPYKDDSSYGKRIKTFVIPINDVPDCYTLAAHAVLGRHTIWAKSCENPITFEELYGGKRWGWAIQDCVEECEQELVLTAKIQLKNTLTAATTWGVLSTDTPSPLFSGWCDYMSVVGVEGENTYEVIAPSYLGSIKIADMIVENTGSDLNVSFVTDIADNTIEWSYVFVGTEAELEAMTNECPDYLNFPYSQTEWSTQHDYTISLN